MLRRSGATLAIAAALASAAQGAAAQDAGLRMARELARPVAPPAAPSAAGTGTGAAGSERRGLTLDDALSGALVLRADRLDGTRERIEASGRVELRARRETVLADWLAYDVATEEVHGKGNVLLRQGGDWVSGPEVRFRRGDETGHFVEPRFGVGQVGARGDAERLSFAGPDRYDVLRGRVTTCVAPREDWFLRAESIELDTAKKIGTARDARLDFMGLPLLYTPWLEFPLSDDRKSGFLAPVFGSSGTRGVDFALPYYFNLAPNYDATLTPRIMTKRGLQLGGQARYLFGGAMASQGELNAEVLPQDRQTDSDRWLLSWRHNQQLAPWLAGYVNYSRVSDDKYFADLAERVSVTSQSTLAQEAGLNAAFGPLSLAARAQRFQTLQDPDAPITPPYNRVPQLLATLSEVEWNGITLSGLGEYARFSRADVTEGDRAVLYPQLEWRRQGAAWFVAARAALHARHYEVTDPARDGGERSESVVLPITSLDAGLVFERDATLFGRRYVQTLEPRAFYVYIPYRDQSALPVFDTAVDDFNFSQLFTENRYLGQDRVGDANQLTLAVTSRLIDPASGAERARVAVGQRLYFEDQRVTLPNETPRSGSSSDILVGAEGRLGDAWLLNGLAQFNLDTGETERFNVGARWNPGPGKVVAGTWRYTRRLVDPVGSVSKLKQFDLATQWPIDGQWTFLARWNYSIVESKTLEALAGVEYNADCWVLRAVLHRLTTTSQQTSTAFYLQLELNGLARLGNSPLELLRRSVPGFLRSNDPARLGIGSGPDPYPEF